MESFDGLIIAATSTHLSLVDFGLLILSSSRYL
ncbi:hypothetical protein LINGRAPRIM_LOCUS796, partial [Linum grandiflorum]